MGVSYYDSLLPVREPGAGLRTAMAALRLRHQVLADATWVPVSASAQAVGCKKCTSAPLGGPVG